MNTKRDKPSRSPGRRLLRYLALGLLNLLVLVVVVALAAPMLFDPNDYKDTIAREVKARTGRDLTITGDMQLSVLPWLGVTVGEVRLGNAPGFGEEPFLRLDSAKVRVKLLPLISREVRMDTISVQGLELSLSRNEAGRGNWEDLADLAAGDQGGGTEGKAIAAFALGGVRVEDAALSYTDAVSGERLGLTDVDLRTGAVRIGEPVDAELSLRFTHAQAVGRLTGKARLNYDLSAARYGADGIDMTLETEAPGISEGTTRARLTGAVTYDDGARLLMARTVELAVDAPALPGSGLSGDTALSAAGDLDWRVAEQTLTSPALTVTVPGLRHGELSGRARIDTTLAANLETLELSMDGLRASGEVAGGPLGARPLPVTLNGNVRVDPRARRATVGELRLEAAPLVATGELTASAADGAGVVTGKLNAAPFALRTLMTRLGVELPPMRDEKALERVGLSTSFSASPAQVKLSSMRLELDGSVLRGDATLTSAGAARLDLAADALVLDRYLPPDSTAPPPAAAAALPVALIRALDVDARLRVGDLRYAGMTLEKVDLGVKAGGGRLQFHPLQANLFGGSYGGDIRIDARGDAPVMQLDERISKVDLHALLTALGVDTGALDLRGGRSTLALKAQVTTEDAGQQLGARGIMLEGSVAGAAFSGGPVPVSLRGDVAVDLTGKKARLDGVRAGFAELTLSTEMALGFAPGALSYTGTLEARPFDARALAARLGIDVPKTGDAKAFTRVGVQATVDGTASRVQARDLKLTLDQSTVTGELTVADFTDPAYSFDLDVDRLDADRYMPPAATGKSATPGAAATALPVDLVRSLKLDGTVRVGSLKIGGVKLSKVAVTTQAKSGVLKLSPAKAALYDGLYDGNVTVDARGERPRLSVDETISGVQVGALLRDVTGDAPLSGATDLRAVLTATGGDTDSLKRTLDGDITFAVRDGALEKVDMVNAMCTTLAALDFDHLNRETVAAGVIGLLLNSAGKGGAASAPDGTGGTRTEFTDMQGSAHLVKGVARNEDLFLSSPVVQVRGAGTVDLPAGRIDYRAQAELVKSCAGIGQRDLAGQIIPVNITGPIASPKVTPEIPTTLINALRKSRAREAPASAAPTAEAPAPAWSNPDQDTRRRKKAPAPDTGTASQSPAPKDPREELLKGILQGIFK